MSDNKNKRRIAAMNKQHILVEYDDGSFQWIKESSEEELLKKPEIKRIKSYCNANFEVNTKRFRIGKSQFEMISVG